MMMDDDGGEYLYSIDEMNEGMLYFF